MCNQANEEEGLSLNVVEKKDAWWPHDLPHGNLQEVGIGFINVMVVLNL